MFDSIDFRRCCARFATGVAIATIVDSAGVPHGLTVNSFTSVSLAPPLVLICIGHSSNVLPLFRVATHYGINVLSAEQQDLSNKFAMRGQDRFDGVQWTRGHTGVPLIPGALAQLECAVTQVVEAGDHAVFLAEVVRAERAGGTPLLYFDSAYGRLA